MAKKIERSMISRKVAGYWMVILALLAFGILYLRQTSLPYYPRYDSGAYLVAAKSLAAGEGLKEISHPEKPPFILYPPLYPALLAPQVLLFGDSYGALRIHLVLLFLATLYLAYRTFDAPFNSWAVLLLSVSNLARYTTRIQGEIPLAFVIMLTLYLHRKGKKGWLILLPLAAAPIIKPIGLVLPVAYGLDGLIRWIQRRGSYRAPLIAAIAILPFLIWTNWAQPGLLNPVKTPLLADSWTGEEQRLISPADPAIAVRFAGNCWKMINETFPHSLLFSDPYHRDSVVSQDLWPLGLLMIFGIPLIARRSLFYSLLIVIHLLLIAILPTVAPRYIAIFFPLYLAGFLALLRHLDRLHSLLPGALVTGFALLLFVQGVTYPLHLDLWTESSANGIVAVRAAEVLPKDAVVLVNDPYGFFLRTGLPSLSYLRSEQKSPPAYFLHRYISRGGRLTHGANFAYEFKNYTEALARYRIEGEVLDTEDDVILWTLNYEDR